MDHTCLVIPVKAGKEEALHAFYRELESSRKDEYDLSEQRLGITKEIAFGAKTDEGTFAVIYIESEDFQTAFGRFVESKDDFDLWFKEHVLDISGVDLNNPPEMELPELLSVYEAEVAALRS
jgi:hypothetical protein